jgi:hypothetical protein
MSNRYPSVTIATFFGASTIVAGLQHQQLCHNLRSDDNMNGKNQMTSRLTGSDRLQHQTMITTLRSVTVINTVWHKHNPASAWACSRTSGIPILYSANASNLPRPIPALYSRKEWKGKRLVCKCNFGCKHSRILIGWMEQVTGRGLTSFKFPLTLLSYRQTWFMKTVKMTDERWRAGQYMPRSMLCLRDAVQGCTLSKTSVNNKADGVTRTWYACSVRRKAVTR